MMMPVRDVHSQLRKVPASLQSTKKLLESIGTCCRKGSHPVLRLLEMSNELDGTKAH